jgi:LacI family transcriptional regulator
VGVRRRNVTIEDVSREAEVSIATVSLALNGSSRVSARTRQRIEKIAKRLGYFPNEIARSLVNRRTNVIGLILPSVVNPYFAQVAVAVERALRSRNYNLVVANTDDEWAREEEAVRLMLGRRIDGLIITSCASDGRVLGSVLGPQFPTVLLGRTVDGYETEFLAVDHESGTREAVDHLIAHGRRRIGIITGPLRLSDARGRLKGYEAALKAARMRRDSALVFEGDFLEASGAAGIEALLALSNPPDAIFVSNGEMLKGALRALNQRSVRIPDDVALIANDQADWVDLLAVPITTVEQPTVMMATFAADMLLRRIQGPDAPHQRIVLKPQLMIRASCGSHGKRSPMVRAA